MIGVKSKLEVDLGFSREAIETWEKCVVPTGEHTSVPLAVYWMWREDTQCLYFYSEFQLYPLPDYLTNPWPFYYGWWDGSVRELYPGELEGDRWWRPDITAHVTFFGVLQGLIKYFSRLCS